MHIGSLDTFYLEEAFQRMHYYPPPLYGMYIPPWLWYDGNQHGSSDFSIWDSLIVARMAQPAPVTIKVWGDYSPSSGTGTVYAQFRNDSTAEINGRVIFVITEDSIHYLAPNGVEWHSNVPKDYLPDQNGQTITLPPGDSLTLSEDFTIQSSWNPDKCNILTWIQNDQMQPDSTKEIWQGHIVKLIELSIKERTSEKTFTYMKIFPNPSVGSIRFEIGTKPGERYSLNIFDVTGRLVRSISGIATRETEEIVWFHRDDNGKKTVPGVYLYRLEAGRTTNTGKLVLR